MIMVARFHRAMWGLRFVQRFFRGHMARKRHGGRLVEIRMRRKAEEEARRKAAEEEKAAKGREEIERIKQMARSNTGAGLSTQASAKYSSKSSWGFLDLLGITQNAASQQAMAAAPPGPPVTSTKSRSSVSAPAASTKVSMPPPTDAINVLEKAIHAIQKHFKSSEVPGATKTMVELGDDSQNKEIAVLVRGQLCTALSRVLLHGFKSFKLIGRYHIWDFVQESCEATHKRLGDAKQKYTDAERTLTNAVIDVNSHEGMANNPNIKFRSFVRCALNAGLLHDWVKLLTVDKDTMTKFYESWAFVNSKDETALKQMMDTLVPLSGYKYTLSLDYELNRWDIH